MKRKSRKKGKKKREGREEEKEERRRRKREGEGREEDNTLVGYPLQCTYIASRSCKSHRFLALLPAENLREAAKLRDRANHCTSHSAHTHCHIFDFRRELNLKNWVDVHVYWKSQ